MSYTSLYENMTRIFDTIPEYTDVNLEKTIDNLDEHTLWQILFSDYPNENIYDNHTKKYVNYILNNKSIDEYNHNDMLNNTIYYGDNMNIISNSNPSEEPNIVDYDISRYASDEIKAYLFYIDVISEIYNSSYETQFDDNGRMFEDEIQIKCRYYYQNNGVHLFQPNDVKDENTEDIENIENIDKGCFSVTLKIKREGIDGKVVGIIPHTKDKYVTNLFKYFQLDIMHHLTYLYGNDMRVIDRKYFRDVKRFFLLCRLKLMYFIIHSLKLRSIQHNDINYAQIQHDIDGYTRGQVYDIFVNFKQNITDTKNVNKNSYGMEVMNKSNKLIKMNRSISNHTDALARKKKLQRVLKQEYKRSNNINIVAKMILICTLFISGIIIFYKQNSYSKTTLSLTLFVIIGFIYSFLIYSYESIVNVETFENYTNTNPYDIVYEILSEIQRSMSYNANEINKTMILKKMNNEYDKYNKYNVAMNLNVKNANADLEVKSIENKTLQANTEYILHISLLIPFTILIYNLTDNMTLSFASLVIIFGIATFIYYMSIFKRVRTRARQYYWSTISTKNSNYLSPTATTIL